MMVGRLLLLLLLLVPSLAASDLSDREVLELLGDDHPRDVAIDRALGWIRAQQQDDGRLVEGDQHRTVHTSFGLMAHFAAGITPQDPEHGPLLRRSLDFVLRQQDQDGYFGRADGSRMYGHGITTLMLAETLGMVGDLEMEERVREALVRAVAVTVAAARVDKPDRYQGGWRYHPGEKRSDMSLSGWQLMSLHAAQQVGIPVPVEVVEAAVAYARRMTTDDGKVGYDKPGADKPALRGLGMLCMVIAGEDGDSRIDRIAERIEADPIAWRGPWLFYRAYYDAVGLSRARPERWRVYGPHLTEVLVSHQHEQGYWPQPPGDNEGRFGRMYTTAMAVLALAVDRHMLPAYQR